MDDTDTVIRATSQGDGAAPRLLVTVATYNEIENLPDLASGIFRSASRADLLVIDDNSPDDTGDWCDRAAAEDARIRCIHREGKLGLGSATIAAMKYAIAQDYDLMLNMDADFSHHPRYIPGLLSTIAETNVDVAIGSRYVRGGGVEGWPVHRKLMSAMVNGYARCMLGLPVRDTSGAFRCYRVETLRRLDFDAIVSTGYSFQEEILWRLKRIGARFAEFPIVFADRQRGKSKIDSREAVAALRVIGRLGMKNWLRV